ncbi:MAG: DUF3892 domain-containing protein [Ktedonobacterales bacterium]
MAWTPGCNHQHVSSVSYHNAQSQVPIQRLSATRTNTRQQMITLLKQAGNEASTYACHSSTARVLIQKCNSGIEYLTTEPDVTKVNNLDELPLCSH